MIQKEMRIKGRIVTAGSIEIFGYVDGEVEARDVLVHKDGRLYGTLKADSADISGNLQGEIVVKNLISISKTGSVNGEVRYGQLAMAQGGELSATMRNVPPELGGDLHLSVVKGRSVAISTADLIAFDPDDSAESLTYSVSKLSNGFVTLSSAPKTPVEKFTQADLKKGVVKFVHDGSADARAGFAVFVADKDGATSGAAQTVTVDVRSTTD